MDTWLPYDPRVTGHRSLPTLFQIGTECCLEFAIWLSNVSWADLTFTSTLPPTGPN